ncbi:FMN-dependent alpha-hydroxy acid dehydrogenase [Exidia glandulosa HHB12029]|uniref:FMN-dependent alpha-hydroxy acid dehydrogenase n=1 Tax=Exidia glandulosa HHB12029 TaxID=1314781 RepID=A0A165K9A5_EXIGL|nr:FMN-dependent alpha-hydroxy acid dehydrogenase [Exidia glandulosa HHB12029]
MAAAEDWSSYGGQIFRSRKPPLLGSVVVDDLEALMKEKFKDNPGPYNFVAGGASTGVTQVTNRKAFNRWKIVPRMLRDVTKRDISVTLFDRKLPAPVAFSPVGAQGIFHEDGDLASARAAGKLGIPFSMSTVASRSIGQVAEACGTGPRWFQLYWPESDELTASILSRAEAAGFDVLLLTLDTMRVGWRPRDLNSAYVPMAHGYSAQVFTADPVFMAKNNLPPTEEHAPFPYNPHEVDAAYLSGDPAIKQRVDLSLHVISQMTNGVFRSWEDMAFVRKTWKGPLLLKGIQCVEDAILAMEHGANGIVVSNHGGRQLDGAIGSLTALARICADPRVRKAQQLGTFTVLFDSGVRSGSDIIKAIALGAQTVLVGRPYVYGLALGGEAGVDAVMRSILADLDISLALSGYKSISEIWHKRDEVLVEDDT